MSDSIPNDPPSFAKKRLTDASRTKDTSLRLVWAITIGEALLLGVLAVALMDYWLMLPVWIRTLGASVLGLLTAFGVYRFIRFWRNPTPLKEVALDVEAQRPELGCQVSTAAEYLSGERTTTREYEPELVAALEAKAAEALSSPNPAYQRRVVRPALVLFLTLFLLLIIIVVAPVAFTAVRRAALPFSNAHYTQVQVRPGDLEIPVGQDVEITNVFSGRAPKNPEVHWQHQNETSWQTAALTTRSSDGAYLVSFKKLQNNLKYWISGNDANSPIYEIKTYVPPTVKDLSLRIEYPAYTRIPPLDQKSPDVSAVRASTIKVQVESSTKLSQARLRFSPSEELPLHPDADGNWTGTLKLAKDTEYWIELADEKGHRGGDDKPHHIKALPDMPPKVEIEDPGQDTHASATNQLPIKISVADDYGVEQVEVVFHKLGGSEKRVTANRQADKPGELTATVDLDLPSLDLKDFDLVEYHAEARDNNTLDGPGVGKSPVYFVEITNLESSPTKGKPQPGQKLNLVEIQKQIIADTTALASDAASEKFQALNLRQRDAKDFGQIYLDTLTAGGAPAAATNEMQSAIKDMESAGGLLAVQKRSSALPPEESALAHLYQVLKQMPQLENMPTQPKLSEQKLSPTNQLAVVLEAIKEKKKEQADDQAIEDALQQAQKLAVAQAALNLAMRHPQSGQGQGQPKSQSQPNDSGDKGNKPTGQNPGESKETQDAKDPAETKSDSAMASDQTNGQGKGQGQQLAQAKAQGEGQGEGKGQGQGQGKGQGEGQGQGKGLGKGKNQGKQPAQGQGQGQAQAKGQGQGPGQGQGEQQGDPNQAQQQSEDQLEPKEPDQMAQQEQQLSKEAQQLADKLERLAGKDKRVGHNAGQNAKLGGQKIAQASDELKKGNFGAAGVNGFQGEVALRKVTEQLERVLKDRPELSDAASEDAPKQFEPLISEYFKRLSHAE